MLLIERLHNPAGRRCGCPSECICQRSTLGRAFRWYIPRGFHTGISHEEKAARLRAARLDVPRD
jgi:hypothetical protein